jgi:hypothetical protein
VSRTLPVAELAKMFQTVLARARRSSVSAACHTIDGQLVKISGQAAPGPQGLLTAPMSGTPCVWYRSVTSPFLEQTGYAGGLKVQRVRVSPVVPSSGLPPERTSARHNQQVQSPDTPFAVVDGDDRIVIDPSEAIVDSEVVTYNEFRRDEQGRATALLQEWVLPAGQPVLAFGVPRGTSNTSVTALRPDAAGNLVIATHTEQYLLSRSNVRLPNVKLIVSGAVLGGLVVLVLILVIVLVSV